MDQKLSITLIAGLASVIGITAVATSTLSICSALHADEELGMFRDSSTIPDGTALVGLYRVSAKTKSWAFFSRQTLILECAAGLFARIHVNSKGDVVLSDDGMKSLNDSQYLLEQKYAFEEGSKSYGDFKRFVKSCEARLCRYHLAHR
jgi:hypothetical protein